MLKILHESRKKKQPLELLSALVVTHKYVSAQELKPKQKCVTFLVRFLLSGKEFSFAISTIKTRFRTDFKYHISHNIVKVEKSHIALAILFTFVAFCTIPSPKDKSLNTSH